MKAAASPLKDLSSLFLHLLLPCLALPALGYSLSLQRNLVPLPLHQQVALMFALLCVYSLDRYFERRRDTGALRKKVLLGLSLLAALAALVCVPYLADLHLPVLLACGSITLAYPFMKYIPGLKNLAVPLVWTLALLAWTQSAPLNTGQDLLAACELFLLVGAATLLCDLPEAEAREEGSLMLLLGKRRALILLRVLLAALVLLSLLQGCFLLPGMPALLLLLQSMFPQSLKHHEQTAILADGSLALPGLLFWGVGLLF